MNDVVAVIWSRIGTPAGTTISLSAVSRRGWPAFSESSITIMESNLKSWS